MQRLADDADADVRVCRNLLEFVCTFDVVNSLEDLVAFARTVSSALVQLTKGVNTRLTSHSHSQSHSQATREHLSRALEHTKRLIPMLISSVRTIISEKDATPIRRSALVENRDALVREVSRTLGEIIRLLRNGVNVNVSVSVNCRSDKAEVNPLLTLIGLADSALLEVERYLPAAQSWINDSQTPVGSPNEAAFKRILELCTWHCRAMNDSALQVQLQRVLPQSQSREIEEDRRSLARLVDEIAALVSGLIEMRASDQREKPSAHSLERGLKAKLPQLKETLQTLRTRLNSESRRGQEASGVALLSLSKPSTYATSGKLVALVSEATIDLHGPLRQLVTAARTPQSERTSSNESAFERLIDEFLNRNNALLAAATGVHQELYQSHTIATDTDTDTESLLQLANNLMILSPQVLAAVRLRLVADEANTHAEQLLAALHTRWLASADRLRVAIDSKMDNSLVRSLEETVMRRHADAVRAIDASDVTSFALVVADSARRAHRIVLFARAIVKADSVRHTQLLEPLITTYVTYATNVVRQPNDGRLIAAWQDAARLLQQQVTKLRVWVESTATHFPNSSRAVSRDEDDGTDTDTEDAFPTSKLHASSRDRDREPLLQAARELHMDVRQWSSSDNEIVAAAKRLALLMAHLSQIVKDENCTKNELTESSRAINQAAVEITRLSKQVVQACGDRLMRAALLQACERIPSVATQLKIVATVKASLLGTQGGDEDREATEALINNAKNLMEAVRDTVKAAESASIKMRIDAGITLKWLRKRPWYI